MKTKTFEDFLIDRHADQYRGLDDEMPDDYEEWMAELDGEELSRYAELYGKERFRAGIKACIDLVEKAVERHLTDHYARGILQELTELWESV